MTVATLTEHEAAVLDMFRAANENIAVYESLSAAKKQAAYRLELGTVSDIQEQMNELVRENRKLIAETRAYSDAHRVDRAKIVAHLR